MRNAILGGALVCALSLTAAAPAFATDTVMDASLKATPAKAGTKKKPRRVSLTLGIEGSSKTGQPSPTTRLKVTLPKGFTWNGKRWPAKKRCSASMATIRKTASVCPAGSKVGSGHVSAVAGNGTLTEEIDLTAFVTTGGNLGLFLDATQPVPLKVMLEGKVRGRTIDVAIPQNIQEPVPGVPTGIKTLRFSLGRGVVKSTSCPGRKWSAKVTNVLRDGSLTEKPATACR